MYLFQFLFNTSNIVCKYTNIFPNYQIICCLFLCAEYFRQFHFDLVSTQTAGDDSAVGAEEDDFRDAGDAETEALSGEIATKIQNEMTYPGQVKITVIRETRSVAYAK